MANQNSCVYLKPLVALCFGFLLHQLTIDHHAVLRAENVKSNSNLNYSNNDSHKCSRNAIQLTRQALTHEFGNINQLNFAWFSDLTRDEISSQQRESLTNLVNLGRFGTNDSPLFEIEASYFRPLELSSSANPLHGYNKTEHPDIYKLTTPKGKLGPIIKLHRRHTDKCHYNEDKKLFTYTFGIAVWPIQHHLDLIFNLPKELRRSQPTDWTYSSATILVPKLLFEITIKQDDSYTLNSDVCPLEIADITFVPVTENQVKVYMSNVASTNETKQAVDRFFNDYTRPAVTEKLDELLRFYLSSKTLPLSI